MPTRPLALPVGSTPSRNGHEGYARLVNCYAEQLGEQAKAPFAIYPCDGFTLFSTLTGGDAVRGLFVVDATLLAVSGRQLFRVDLGGTATAVGGIPSDGPVYMARNRVTPQPEVAMVCDGLAYIYQGGSLTAISDSDLPNPIDVAFLDGYFLYTVADGRIFSSELDDGSNINALDFTTAEAKPDNNRRGIVRGREYWVFGSESIEIYQNTGETNFPLSRLTFVDTGCLSAPSVVNFADSIAWVADDGTVRLAEGYTPKKISNHAVERDIASLAYGAEIKAFARSERGHEFLTLSTDSWTWEFDLATGAWIERTSQGESRWRAEWYANFQGKHIVGDFEAGKLYQLSDTAYAEASDDLIMEIYCPIAHAMPQRLGFNAVWLDVIPGVGLNSSDSDVSNPRIMMSYSDNGGKTFGNERTASVGTIGQFRKRVKFTRLGQCKQGGRIFKFSMSAAVIRGVISAAVDLTPGRA